MPTVLWKHPPSHRQVAALTLPMMASNLSVPLVTLTDTSLIGHLGQAHLLSAMAIGGLLYGCLVGILSFLRMGITGITAQAWGRQDHQQVQLIFAQGLLLAAGISLGLLLIAPWLIEAILPLFKPSPALTEAAGDYLQTRLYGLPATLMGYVLCGWFLALQRPLATLQMLLITNLSNLLLDFWFILGLDWGLQGAAQASVCAEWAGLLGGAWQALHILRQLPERPSGLQVLRDAGWRQQLSINRDLLIRALLLQGVFILLTIQGSRLGETIVAANALVLNGLQLTAHILDGLAHALEALSGHAMGSHNRLALQRAVVVAGGWALLGSVLFSLGFALFGSAFFALQTNLSEVRQQAEELLPYLVALPLLAVGSYLLDGLFLAATQTRALRNTLLLACLLVLPLALLFNSLGNHGLWLTFCSFMLLRTAIQLYLAWHIAQAESWLQPHDKAPQQ